MLLAKFLEGSLNEPMKNSGYAQAVSSLVPTVDGWQSSGFQLGWVIPARDDRIQGTSSWGLLLKGRSGGLLMFN